MKLISADAQCMAADVAAQAAIAIDIARPPEHMDRGEKIATQAAPAESEHTYRELVRALPAAVYMCDAAGRITLYNEAAAALWDRAPVIGETMWCGSYRMRRPDGSDLPLDQCPMAVALKERRALNAEAFVERPDGTLRHVLAHPRPMFDAAGTMTGALNLLVDITDRKAAERELGAVRDDLALQVAALTRIHGLAMHLASPIELQPALSSILETLASFHHAPRALLSLRDADSGILQVRASVGFDPDTLRRVAQLAPDGRSGACGAAFFTGERTIIEDVETDARFESYRELGRTLGFGAVHSTPIVTRAGKVLGVLSVHFDEPRQPTERERQFADMCALHATNVIEADEARTALRRTNRRLEAMRAQLETITETMSAAVAHVDRDGRFLWANANYAHRLNRTPEDLEGARIQDVLGEEVWAIKKPYVERVLAGERVEYEALLPIREIGPRWYHSAYSPTHGESSSPGSWVAVITDITHHKEMQEALRGADRRKDEFLAMLAHELRNPLAPIRNALQIMQLTAGDERVQVDARELISRQLAQMVRLVDDLLDVSRISRGKIALRREWTELRTIVDQAVETSRPLIDAAHHRLTVELPAEPLVVNVDLARMSQVFANLLNNAAKYTPPGGDIALTVEARGGTLRVAVRDTGMGIPPEMLGHVFEMFTQVDRSLERARGGLGIGLSVAKRLVEMHGGSIEAHSAGADQGSEFVVTLRLAPTSDQRTAPHSVQDTVFGELQSRRVLVADDNEDAANTLASLLQLMGSEVRIAHDGNEALAAADLFRPEIVLLDIGMPGLTGHDVCRRIRAAEWGRSIVIAALTGWGQEADRRKSREAGFDHHLVKPVEVEALHRILSAPLPRSSASDAVDDRGLRP